MRKNSIYNHYIAIDWSIENMAIARMTKKSNKTTVIDVPSDINNLKLYLKRLKDSKILVIEETTTSQWLYTELKDYVDKIIFPYFAPLNICLSMYSKDGRQRISSADNRLSAPYHSPSKWSSKIVTIPSLRACWRSLMERQRLLGWNSRSSEERLQM